MMNKPAVEQHLVSRLSSELCKTWIRTVLTYLASVLLLAGIVIYGAHQTVPIALVWIAIGVVVELAMLALLSEGLRSLGERVGTNLFLDLLVVGGLFLLAIAEVFRNEFIAAGAVAFGLPAALIIDFYVDTRGGKVASIVAFGLGSIGLVVSWYLLTEGDSASRRLIGAGLGLASLAAVRLGLPRLLDGCDGRLLHSRSGSKPVLPGEQLY